MHQRRERSSTTTPAERSSPGDVSPSNIPARSPWTSRRSSRATCLPSCRRPSRLVPSNRAAAHRDASNASATRGRVGSAARSSATGQGDVGGSPLLRKDAVDPKSSREELRAARPGVDVLRDCPGSARSARSLRSAQPPGLPPRGPTSSEVEAETERPRAEPQGRSTRSRLRCAPYTHL